MNDTNEPPAELLAIVEQIKAEFDGAVNFRFSDTWYVDSSLFGVVAHYQSIEFKVKGREFSASGSSWSVSFAAAIEKARAYIAQQRAEQDAAMERAKAMDKDAAIARLGELGYLVSIEQNGGGA